MEDLEAGNISSDIHFDQAFENWKNGKKQALTYEVANEWGINGEGLKKSVDAYSITSPEDIPFIDDLIGSLDFSSAKKSMEVISSCTTSR